MLAVALVAFAYGCATSSPFDQPPAPGPDIVDQPPIDAGAATQTGANADSSAPAATVAAPAAAATLPAAPRVAIVVNDPRGLRQEMMNVFAVRLGEPYEVFNLAHRSVADVRGALAELAPLQAVVIGPAALNVASNIPGVSLVHAGVLDPPSGQPGVDALPPFDIQLDYWLELAPKLERIGVIGSQAVGWRVDALAAACAERGLALEQHEVGTDQETLRAFRSMVPYIDGFVFLPDQAVLSPGVIQQMIRHGQRNQVQMLVYSPLMFNLGADLFLQADPVEVAVELVRLIHEPQHRARVASMRSESRLETPAKLITAAADSPVAGDG